MARKDRPERERTNVRTHTIRLPRRARVPAEEIREGYEAMGPLNQELAEEAISDREFQRYESRLAEAE